MSEHRSKRAVISTHLRHLKEKVRNPEDDGVLPTKRTVIYANLKHLKNKIRNREDDDMSQEEVVEVELVEEEDEEEAEEVGELELSEEEISETMSTLRLLDSRLATWVEVRENTILQLREIADYIDRVGRRTNKVKAGPSTADQVHRGP